MSDNSMPEKALKTSKSQRDAIEKYEKSIDKYLLRLPSGTKTKLEEIARDKGFFTKAGKPSINQLINAIVAEYLKKN